jgi:hypothetical protein
MIHAEPQRRGVFFHLYKAKLRSELLLAELCSADVFQTARVRLAREKLRVSAPLRENPLVKTEKAPADFARALG